MKGELDYIFKRRRLRAPPPHILFEDYFLASQVLLAPPGHDPSTCSPCIVTTNNPAFEFPAHRCSYCRREEAKNWVLVSRFVCEHCDRPCTQSKACGDCYNLFMDQLRCRACVDLVS